MIAIKAWEESRMAMGRGEIEIGEDHGFRSGYITGYTTAQQSQPMWREIEGDKSYEIVIVRCNSYCEVFQEEVSGRYLLDYGFTHYLSSEDLLKLPTETTKTTPQERG